MEEVLQEVDEEEFVDNLVILGLRLFLNDDKHLGEGGLHFCYTMKEILRKKGNLLFRNFQICMTSLMDDPLYF